MSKLIKHHINEVMDMHCLTKGKMGYSVVYYANDVDKVIAEYQEKIIALEKSYKKLVKRFVHETSVAESYRSLIYKEDALKYQEAGNSEMYDELSKKSDKAYRHANRWRRIFRKMSQEADK